MKVGAAELNRFEDALLLPMSPTLEVGTNWPWRALQLSLALGLRTGRSLVRGHTRARICTQDERLLA
jgi:hypothetical protein